MAVWLQPLVHAPRSFPAITSSDTLKLIEHHRPKAHAIQFPAANPPIPPTLFQGNDVFIEISDPHEAHAVMRGLTAAGAVIRSSSDVCQVIVSIGAVTIPVPLLSPTLSRGSKLAIAAKSDRTRPRNVLTSQIPWVFTIPAKPDGQIADPPQDMLIVVSHIKGSHAPAFLRLRELPVLHLDEVPKGYSCCPFDPIDDRVINLINKRTSRIVAPIPPPEKGFCEICGAHYDGGEMHRFTPGHQTKIREGIWADFDRIAGAMPII
jgi:hypothetical protein